MLFGLAFRREVRRRAAFSNGWAKLDSFLQSTRQRRLGRQKIELSGVVLWQ